MFGDKKIIFLSVLDANNRSYQELTRRIVHHQQEVMKLTKESCCLVGRRTQEMTGWKGPGVWVLTKDRKWRRNGVSVLHDIEDARLHLPQDEIYVLGGISIFRQLRPTADEFMIWNIHDKTGGTEEWIDLDMSAWKPIKYKAMNNWTYARLSKIKK